MKIPYKPELLDEFNNPHGSAYCAERIKVIGGWIVRHVAWDNEKDILSESSVFVPDACHDWEIK